jgi:peptidoglycan/xylan/chitin deacetylase (PgdA/CDA1 family)
MMLIGKAKRKLYRIFRENWVDFCFWFFGYLPRRVINERGVRVLIYHGICKNEPQKFNSRFLTEKLFEEHLVAIKKYCNPISYKDYKEGRLSSNKLNVLITFDDGLKNNYELALPLLIKHKVPAIFFVTLMEDNVSYLFSDLLDVFSLIGPERIKINAIEFTKQKKAIHYRYVNEEGNFLAHYFHPCNAEEREEIAKQIFKYTPWEEFKTHGEYLFLASKSELVAIASANGMYVGSHGTTHADFSLLKPDELNIELTISAEKIEQITKRKCDLVAFPYGNYNQTVLEKCKALGYQYMFGTEKLNSPEDRELIIERFTINPFVSAINQLNYIARNKYE